MKALGNFVALAYRYKGKIYKGLPKSASGHETRLEGESTLPHIFHQ